MKKPTKAVLISGLVFPGLGHIYLRSYIVGVALVCLAAWSIYSVADTSIGIALDIAGEIENGGLALDSASIGQLAAQRSQEAEQSTNLAIWVFMASWVIGIVDSYRIGRRQERQEKMPVPKET